MRSSSKQLELARVNFRRRLSVSLIPGQTASTWITSTIHLIAVIKKQSRLHLHCSNTLRTHMEYCTDSQHISSSRETEVNPWGLGFRVKPCIILNCTFVVWLQLDCVVNCMWFACCDYWLDPICKIIYSRAKFFQNTVKKRYRVLRSEALVSIDHIRVAMIEIVVTV